MKHKGAYISILSSLSLIALWYVVALVVGAPIIIPSPGEVLRELVGILCSSRAYSNIGMTVLRALWSFVLVVLAGGVLGILAGVSKTFRLWMGPVVTVFKATPVMSVILIAFLWLRTGEVPVFSAFLMAFPVMFIQTVQGYGSVDPKLDQMCRIYGISGKQRLRELVLPSLLPYLVTGAKQTLSMVWKVVIAAEVLTIPRYGIGRSMQLAQIQLETALVFAWTIVAIALTAIGDYAFGLLSGGLHGN